MQQLTNQQRLKPWMGFVLFAVLMGLFVTVCAYMQMHWGMIGLVTSELVFLVLAIAYALIFRIPLKEMFPIKKFSARDFFGSLLLVLGGVSFGLISIALVGILIPSSLESSDVQALQKMMTGPAGYLVLVLIIAVTPAICEEAIHRGAILSSFRSIKKDWLIVLIMAILFGINHLSVLRFINTAILGACLSYIVVKKNNILLSSLMHFFVNFSSATISYLATKLLENIPGAGTADQMTMTADSLKQALSTYLIGGIAAPFLIVLGLLLLNPATHKKKRFLFAGIIAGVMLISGFASSAVNLFQSQLVQTTLSYKVTAEDIGSEENPISFTMDKDGSCKVVVVMANAEGKYSVRIRDSKGEVVHDKWIPEGAMRIDQVQIPLEAGDYKLYIVSGDGAVGEEPAISIQVNKQ